MVLVPVFYFVCVWVCGFSLVPYNYDIKAISEDGSGRLRTRGEGQSGSKRFLTHDPGLVIT